MRERNYLYEYKLPGQDKPRLEKAVNVDFVPFIRSVRVLCKPRLIFSRINGPNKPLPLDYNKNSLITRCYVIIINTIREVGPNLRPQLGPFINATNLYHKLN